MRLLVLGGSGRVGRLLLEQALLVHETVAADLVLRRVSPGEVARFVLDCLEDRRTIGKVFFIGHR